MSLRIDTSEQISGALVIGNTGLGELGSTILADTATGTHGPGYLYNDVDGGDSGKEFQGLIVTPPSAGTFFAYEDGSFSLTGAADGSYSFVYRLYVDGVDLGTATSYITIGAGGTDASASGSVDAVDLISITGAASTSTNATATGVMRGVYLYAPTYPIPVPPKPIRKTQYIPTGSVPGDVAGIQRFLQLEFERLNNGLESPFTHDSYEVLHVEPGKKQADRVYLVFADGTDWDPGSGRGFYYYDSGTWTFLG